MQLYHENYTEIQDYELHNEKDLKKYFELTSKVDETRLLKKILLAKYDELQISFWAEQFDGKQLNLF